MEKEIMLRLSAVGMVNALGSTAGDIFRRLCAGDQSRFTRRDDIIPGRAIVVGAVHEPLPPIDRSLRDYDCRNNALALAALLQIADSVSEAVAAFGAARVGVVVGTSTSGIAATEQAMARQTHGGSFPREYTYRQHEAGGLAQFVARAAGVRGPAYTVSTACSSGAKTFTSGRALIEAGLCDAVIVGGVDSLCSLTPNGFAALEVLAHGISNPMSKNRDGITIGEGAALFLLTAGEKGVVLRGIGESSDAYHMSAPDPEGTGAERAMRTALDDAGAAPEQIDYINMHGTGTPLNDRTECMAIDRIFPSTVPCSSSKAQLGHTLGAAGAMGVGIGVMVLSSDEPSLTLPPHCWDGVGDPEIPPVRLVKPGERVLPKGDGMVLINAFAFGGNNSAVVLGRD